MNKSFLIIPFFLTLQMCAQENGDIDRIKLPEGFRIDVYAEGIDGARSMTLGDNGTVFVGCRSKDKVYAIIDNNGDNKADKVLTITDKLNRPNGVEFKDGNLYVAEVNKIWRFDNIEDKLDNPPKPILISDDYPSDTHHGWKYIRFGPDGKLYVPVGAPCNVCENDDKRYASMTRINADGSGQEIFAEGIRNSVGFDWHPETEELWFTDNGRDWLGENKPNDELNRAPKAGMHFGFPYCHAGEFLDPKFGAGKDCEDFTPPAQKLGAHVASLGMKFYTGDMFPKEYKNQIFIAEHGSWNRINPDGYRVSLVKLEGNKAVSYEVFAEGWLQKGGKFGRPVDLLQLPDGSLLVSDDHGDRIYRISYSQ